MKNKKKVRLSTSTEESHRYIEIDNGGYDQRYVTDGVESSTVSNDGLDGNYNDFIDDYEEFYRQSITGSINFVNLDRLTETRTTFDDTNNVEEDEIDGDGFGLRSDLRYDDICDDVFERKFFSTVAEMANAIRNKHTNGQPQRPCPRPPHLLPSK